jgi:hypothetical protein
LDGAACRREKRQGDERRASLHKGFSTQAIFHPGIILTLFEITFASAECIRKIGFAIAGAIA